MKMRHPIIVGVGQVTNHSPETANAPHPLKLAEMAVRNCVEDCECKEILKHTDSIHIVNIISWQYANPPDILSDMLEIKPRIKEYTNIGGNTPQLLVNRVADKIASGEIEIAILVGAEAMYTVTKAMSSNRQLSWPGSEGGLLSNIIEEEHEGVNTQEKIHGAMYPIQIYPLFENALRAEKGISIEEHNKNLADFCAEFSNIASENPYAWFREKKSSREIGQITDANRMIGFPYPKFMNSIMNVNQAAGVIVTSNEIAEKLSIPKNKWVYLHGGAEANDKWFVSDRVSYTISPAIREISKTALEMAGITLDQIDFFDLYSCFPCAPIIAAKSMGMDLNTLPPLTITGGLPYFGGAGNNYSMHAIAQAVEMLRKNPNNFGYISALGWFITKHAAGIYSGIEPQRPWDRSGFPDIQQKIEDMDSPEICEAPEGPATVETYTVIHDRQGKPDNAIIIARLDDARRCWAKTKDDQELLLSMGKEEFIGKKGFVSPGNNSPNIMRFK